MNCKKDGRQYIDRLKVRLPRGWIRFLRPPRQTIGRVIDHDVSSMTIDFSSVNTQRGRSKT